MAAALVAASWGQGAFAREASEDALCRNGLFSSSESHWAMARVMGSEPVALLEDMSNCPEGGAPACESGEYAKPGERVILGQSSGEYRCAYAPDAQGGGRAGWIPSRRLRLLPIVAVPPVGAWTGMWSNGTDRLRLTANADGTLSGQGNAYWPGPPGTNIAPLARHFGGISARAAPMGQRLELKQSACQVTAWLLNDLLVVDDNGQCGGMNVRFSGVYRKRATGSPPQPH
ncbi:hypothetical protein BJI69_13680 [Luteibacter rhizovicinus DSM 16549]|uniref:Uncharacterized protein n=1 Tax=Luteibacter rhizovicinus DSM 16549 TaxID=1440763 RepID=A0A1L3EUX2_9GAMM|nr:hypothetical protein [Luteibacter rhizovicinus]APG04839.1 hypothetical protein BJI69_13680 [Luteibacter rhizovicinus DSM 16549]